MNGNTHSDSAADAVLILANSGANVNAIDWRGNTPLHLAACGGHASAVQALLAAGADPNAQNIDGESPLHCASRGGLEEALPQSAFEHFTKRCIAVWNELHASHECEMSYGEETVTDNLCLALLTARLRGVEVHKATKWVEGKTGVDLELYVGNEREGWWSYFIQAKRLEVIPEKYIQLLHYRRSDGARQFDLLQHSAKAANAIPLYGFYNFVSTHVGDDCFHCKLPMNRALLGWTVAPAEALFPFVESERIPKFREIHLSTNTFPARCLLCGSIASVQRLDDHPLKGSSFGAIRLPVLPAYVSRSASTRDDLLSAPVGRWIVVVDTNASPIDCRSVVQKP